ncbi:MAG: hypothetical protein IJ806_06965 [Ruminococcus sp.]|nr:hypothetical protein [Ruminococcus sp.]
MALSEARKKANKKWNAQNLEKLQADLPKGYNDKIKARAFSLGLSKAAYIKKLVDEDMKKTNGPAGTP